MYYNYSMACKTCGDADCDNCDHKYDNNYIYSPCDDCEDMDCDICEHKNEY